MTRKVYLEDGSHDKFLRKQDLHAEHPVDVKTKPEKLNHAAPRNPLTHVSIRLPMTWCDWIWEMYPNEPTISSAVQHYLKDRYESSTQAGSVR